MLNNIQFTNKTKDQFSYIESTSNLLKDNFDWWKDNWKQLENLLAKILDKSLSDNRENSHISISSRFTIFHGKDDNIKDVIWTGPAIIYTFEGASNKVINNIKDIISGISQKNNLYLGHKMFTSENQLIILFG